MAFHFSSSTAPYWLLKAADWLLTVLNLACTCSGVCVAGRGGAACTGATGWAAASLTGLATFFVLACCGAGVGATGGGDGRDGGGSASCVTTGLSGCTGAGCVAT